MGQDFLILIYPSPNPFPSFAGKGMLNTGKAGGGYMLSGKPMYAW